MSYRQTFKIININTVRDARAVNPAVPDSEWKRQEDYESQTNLEKKHTHKGSATHRIVSGKSVLNWMLTIIIIGEVNIWIGANTGSKILSNIIKYIAIIGMQGIHSMTPNINVVIIFLQMNVLWIRKIIVFPQPQS